MDFHLNPKIDDLRLQIRNFVDTETIPLEADRTVYDHHENIAEDVLEEPRTKTKAQGLWTGHCKCHKP